MSKSSDSRNQYATFGTSKDGEFVICTDDALVFLSREEVQRMMKAIELWEDGILQDRNAVDSVTLPKSSYEEYEEAQDGDDWIIWYGGECPVTNNEYVQVMYRDGDILNGDADDFSWTCSNTAGDIVAYRIIDSKE